MRHGQDHSAARKVLHSLLAAIGAVVLTLAFFLVLPLMQTIKESMKDEMVLREVSTTQIEPPPEIEEEPEEPEPEPEKEPPKLDSQQQTTSLAELELAFGEGGLGAGMGSGGLDINVAGLQEAAGVSTETFRTADLDQKPRPVFQPSPNLSSRLRRRTPATVYVIFIVDERGRVVQPKVQQSSDPAFERPALNAIKRWRFEPGKRGGKPVRFRMRIPFVFPESR